MSKEVDNLDQVLNTVRNELAVNLEISGDTDPQDWVVYSPDYLLAKAKASLLMLEAEMTMGLSPAAVRNHAITAMAAITMLTHVKGKL